MENIKATMSECMETDKPLVSIVMAMYHPRMEWLIEQLDSLNAQTYPNLELLICDDGPDMPTDDLIFQEHITAFPWKLVRNEENLGSNKTFERLTGMANGVYVAYCDQDDVWLPEKIDKYVICLEAREKAGLVCSDMIIIDWQGKFKSDSITKVRKHHRFKEGHGLASYLLTSNFVTGCAMMIRAELARKAIPFCPYMVHDHWLALYTAYHAEIAYLNEPLICYRIHSENQTSMMAGVEDKLTYVKYRLIEPLARMEWLKDYYQQDDSQREIIQKAIVWYQARIGKYHNEKGKCALVWKFREFGLWASLFDLVAPHFPERIFQFIIRLKKKNII